MMWQMRCTGRQWCDFVSYDDRVPESMRLFVVRVERDEKVIAELEKKVADFLTEVEREIERLNEEFSS